MGTVEKLKAHTVNGLNYVRTSDVGIKQTLALVGSGKREQPRDRCPDRQNDLRKPEGTIRCDINIISAESCILDVGMAVEISNTTRLRILQQSGKAMAAQANARPRNIMQLMS